MSLIRLNRNAPVAPPQGVLGLLLACHERIRKFTALAARLDETAVPDSERAQAAQAVHTYFTVAMPLHALDEELSLAPRLLELRLPAATARAVEAMVSEHGPLEQIIGEAAPAWQHLVQAPGDHARHQALLARTAAALDREFAAHLRGEETIVFPAITLLSGSEQEAILAELRDRRRTP